MDADKSNLTMAIYLLALAQLEANEETYVAKEIRATQRKLHNELGLNKQNQ
ncbi:hypothetical protein [Sediminibacillus massiliensis]|uniref:hypothetical protein n=1 Tax=Sediminibacillus massiliensis TaxID=1926277 RepID=UPI0015C34B57|nr:hypothetical protein [Sediminibacillus massiliensis]